ncbi:unnamed protein product [Phytophthora fragariaefolia]|uniref:Unnamed protein product n=1 Tax=Phytophthora fragariaefolia TaxID=1490495 RepID=A0A9W7D0T6_9STRA|nr:unnamed protein product [Phytophthora fragariaefolia]
MTTKAFVAMSSKGAFQREASRFRNWIKRDNSAVFPAEKHRYHLYVSLACPWASRCLGAMYIKGLEDIIGLSVVHPVFQRTRPNDDNDLHCGWAFADPSTTPTLAGPSGLGAYSSKGCIPDSVNNAKFIRDLYDLCTSEPTRYTVPLLWDKKTKTIVSNESADIVRMFNSEFVNLVPSKVDLYPAELRLEIDELNDWVYNDISNGVYKCGFAASQEAYDEAMDKLFAGLDRAEEILAVHRFLVGDVFTEADLRLFTTLIRFDEVYAVHFKANKKLIEQYPNLSNVRAILVCSFQTVVSTNAMHFCFAQYVRDIYQFPPITKSVDMQQIKLHYYASHTHLNPFGIVPAGPGIDFAQPHDRSRFTDATVPKLKSSTDLFINLPVLNAVYCGACYNPEGAAYASTNHIDDAQEHVYHILLIHNLCIASCRIKSRSNTILRFAISPAPQVTYIMSKAFVFKSAKAQNKPASMFRNFIERSSNAAFPADCTPDTVNNARFVRDLYEKCTSQKTPYSVPVLWDKKKNTIVSNDSSDIVRMFNSAFEDLVPSKLDLCPEELRSEIDEINDWIYSDVSHGVYKCGFAETQELYDAAVTNVFVGLDHAEKRATDSRKLTSSFSPHSCASMRCTPSTSRPTRSSSSSIPTSATYELLHLALDTAC